MHQKKNYKRINLNRSNLKNLETIYCFCKHKVTTFNPLFIVCSACEKFFHTTCLGLNLEDCALAEEFYCFNCREDYEESYDFCENDKNVKDIILTQRSRVYCRKKNKKKRKKVKKQNSKKVKKLKKSINCLEDLSFDLKDKNEAITKENLKLREIYRRKKNKKRKKRKKRKRIKNQNSEMVKKLNKSINYLEDLANDLKDENEAITQEYLKLKEKVYENHLWYFEFFNSSIFK